MAKNGRVHEVEKVRRSSATPTKFFSVDFYDLKSMSFFQYFRNTKVILHNDIQSHFVAIPSICDQRSLVYGTGEENVA